MAPVVELTSLTPLQAAAFVALFIPGFVSLKIDHLIHPNARRAAADDLIDIVGYSVLNAGVFAWALVLAGQEIASSAPNLVEVGFLGLLVCVVGPVAWPLGFRWVQRLGSRRGWLRGAHHLAWDHHFAQRRYRFVIVHLTDGTHIGGYFGARSYATVEPESGHLYLEELWTMDAEGGFVARIPDSAGALFRPTDYKWIEFFEDDPDDD
jgi:hypothetical protein